MKKWYSHLEETINQVAYSGKVERIFCGVDNVEITTNAGKHYAFREVDKSSLEKFLNGMFANNTSGVNIVGDNAWFQHLMDKVGFLTTSANYKGMVIDKGVVNIEMKNGVFVFDKSSVREFEEFLNDVLTPITDHTDEIVEILLDAKKDGRIHGFALFGTGVRIHKTELLHDYFSISRYDDIVAYIKSLYREEFTIENIGDIDRVKVDQLTVVTLANGERLSVVRKCNNGLLLWQSETGVEELVKFIALKGAKVIQAC